MSKVIIGIHGLGNKPSKKILEKWWLRAIREGLYKMGKPTGEIRFEMVYWADIIYDHPLDYRIKDPDHELYLDEPYRHSPRFFKKKENNATRKQILDYIEKQLDKLFLNNDLSLNYSFISDAIIHSYFRDLEAYYQDELDGHSDESTRSLIRHRVQEVIEKYRSDEIMIIAHSMGSIVAYDVLTFHLPDMAIDTLVTIGSPLGLPLVQSRIAAELNLRHATKLVLKTPPSIQRYWYNFSDLQDRVSMIYDLTGNFDPNLNGVKVSNSTVFNDYKNKGKANHHKSFGYLRTVEMAEVIYNFLGRPKPTFWNNLKLFSSRLRLN